MNDHGTDDLAYLLANPEPKSGRGRRRSRADIEDAARRLRSTHTAYLGARVYADGRLDRDLQIGGRNLTVAAARQDLADQERDAKDLQASLAEAEADADDEAALISPSVEVAVARGRMADLPEEIEQAKEAWMHHDAVAGAFTWAGFLGALASPAVIALMLTPPTASAILGTLVTYTWVFIFTIRATAKAKAAKDHLEALIDERNTLEES